MGSTKYKEWQYFLLSIRAESDVDHIDEVTWKQAVSNALRKSHGLFGEQIELYWLKIDNKRAIIKCGFADKDILKTALATYISSTELIGSPLVITMEQEASQLNNLFLPEDDKLWFNKIVEIENGD